MAEFDFVISVTFEIGQSTEFCGIIIIKKVAHLARYKIFTKSCKVMVKQLFSRIVLLNHYQMFGYVNRI